MLVRVAEAFNSSLLCQIGGRGWGTVQNEQPKVGNLRPKVGHLQPKSDRLAVNLFQNKAG